MHLFVSAGEPSGDLHAATLTRALLARDPTARVVGFGGDRFAAAGGEVIFPLTRYSIMWLSRSIANLPLFFKIARQAEVYFRSRRPDALVLVDYPGFNLALAKRAHRAGVPVYYFVPPQFWAWGGWRAGKMRKWVRTVFTTLPFEDAWFRSQGVATHYIGHPYFDELAAQAIDRAFVAARRAGGGPVVALLPGSRNQEVAANLTVMLAAAGEIREAIPGVRFLVAAFNDKQADVARAGVAASGLPVEVHVGRTPEVIEAADAAVAVSGSVGLELMYRRTPTVVVYQITPFAGWVTRRFKVSKYISLVNLIADEEVFPEFLPTRPDPAALAGPVVGWLRDPAARLNVVRRLDELRAKVAVPGATDRAADFLRADLGGE